MNVSENDQQQCKICMLVVKAKTLKKLWCGHLQYETITFTPLDTDYSMLY